jgi:hypothetical protein
MLEKIGETLDNIDVFSLSDTVAVDEDGIIYKIEGDELCDSIYCVADFENRESINDIKNHVVNPYKLIIGVHRVDIINNKIDGAPYNYLDNEELDYVLISFKSNELKLKDNGSIEYNIKDEKFKNHIEAIELAYDYEVDEFEDFLKLRF